MSHAEPPTDILRTALQRARTAGMVERELPEIWKDGTAMDRLEAMSVIIAVTETGSISAASRRLKSSVATVSRKVAELESRLKTQLFQRTSRRMTLTDAGRFAVGQGLPGRAESPAPARRQDGGGRHLRLQSALLQGSGLPKRPFLRIWSRREDDPSRRNNQAYAQERH